MAGRDVRTSLCLMLSVFVGLFCPAAFLWVGPTLLVCILRGLAFVMGMTAKADDLRACAMRPRPICLNLVGCFLGVPVLACVLGRAFELPKGHFVDLVMIGCTNGGTGSNVLTLLAKGDVTLSVVMTTTTTICAIIATPGVAKMLLGTVVPVDALGILVSAVVVVLIPTGLGVAISAVLPTFCKAIRPWIPQIALVFAVPLVGSTVAKNADQVWGCDPTLHIAVLAMILLSACMGYFSSWITSGDGQERRAMAIEFAVKNIVFASVLLRDHFKDPSNQVPVAAFAFWASLVCGALATVWGQRPLDLRKPAADETAWVVEYKA